MENVTFEDRIVNTTNQAHTNLENMFGALDYRVVEWNGSSLEDVSIASGCATKPNWKVALHIIGLIALNVIALVAFIVLCVMRANLKAQEVSVIAQAVTNNAEPVEAFEELCAAVSIEVLVTDEGPFRKQGDDAAIRALFDEFEQADFSGTDGSDQLAAMKNRISNGEYSRDTLLVLLKRLYRNSQYKVAIQNSNTPNLEALIQRVLNAPDNKMDQVAIDRAFPKGSAIAIEMRENVIRMRSA